MEEMASANDSAVQAVPMFEAYVQDATFLRWLSIAAAVYLFVIYKTNWRMNIMPMLLVPYIGLNLPSVLFNIIRGDFGRWTALIVVMTYLFFQQFFLDYLGYPTALLLPLVTVPHLLMIFLRNNIIGASMSVAIGVYLLDEHIRSRGPRQAFTEKWGCTNTLAIMLMLVSPILEVYNFIS
jgi:hypothetical protein